MERKNEDIEKASPTEMCEDSDSNVVSQYTSLLKYCSLFVLIIQNTSFTLLVRYSRTAKNDMYLTTTVVLFIELFKLVTCLLITLVETKSITKWFRLLYTDIIADPVTTLKVGVPAFIYVITNNLIFVAMTHIDAATYQVTNQFRLLTTALFSVFMLNKRLTKTQWFSLFLLIIGLALVQLQPSRMRKKTTRSDNQRPIIGFTAVAVRGFLSGFAGVYFEKILKGGKEMKNKSIWLRNIQLGLFGTMLGLISMYVKDRVTIREKGILFGYSPLVWIIIGVQALGGLLVAVVVKYGDNILKGFATACSVVLASIFSIYLFDFIVTQQFAVGSMCVLVAIYLYGRRGRIGFYQLFRACVKCR